MPNYQTECLRVVTIGYLKSFIGDEVQNSSNGSSIHVNYSDDTYCPTYAELTGGTFIQNWQQGSTPNGDRDGIVVNTTCTSTGSAYANNQLVNQKDLSMRYTRFKTFTIGHTGSPVDECGGNVSISYTHQYTRYIKSMASDCTVSTISATASDTANNEVSFSAGCGWVHPKVGTSSVDAQPSNRTAVARSCTVTGSTTFRGTSHTDTSTVSQNALTGSYSNYEGRHYTSVTARATTSTSFTGCGSHSFGASATGYYYDRYEWKDSCGHVYHSSPYNDISGSESAGSQSGSFSEVSCPTTTCNESKSLSFSYHGYSDSVSFSRTGSNSCGCSKPTVWEDYDCSQHLGETITVNGTAYTNCSQDAQGNCNCTTAATSMTVTCQTACTEETVSRYGAYVDTATLSTCDPRSYNGSVSQRIYSSITIHTDCSETLNSTGITSVTSANYTVTGIQKNSSDSSVERSVTGWTSGGDEVHAKLTLPPCDMCSCDSLTVNGTVEPDPQQHFLINVSAKNSTSQHIQFVAFQMIYTDATSDAINFGGGLEITAGQTVVENDIRLQDEHEGKTINFIAVVYYHNGTNVQRSLDNDEWSCSGGGSQLHTGDTLNINFKR